jgi:hypothetical protein
MARIVSATALGLVKNQLGLVDAWPANPPLLPDGNLSKTAKASLRNMGKALKLNTMLLVRAVCANDRAAQGASSRRRGRAGGSSGWGCAATATTGG